MTTHYRKKANTENLMDVIYPYENASRLSLYMLTNKLIFCLKVLDLRAEEFFSVF